MSFFERKRAGLWALGALLSVVIAFLVSGSVLADESVEDAAAADSSEAPSEVGPATTI
jgi:hypothetical protein